jgi:probable phosphoglycerate mutase
MLRLVLIRPGSTDYDREGRIQGTLDIPLSAQGNQEVLQLVESLRPLGMETLYAAQAEPAWQTAELLADRLDVKLKKLDQLHNLDHGLWQGMLIDDVRRKQPKVYRQWQEQPETVCPPEGEMISQAEERLRTLLAKLAKRHKDGIVGIVVPEPMASLVRCFVTNEPVGDLWKASAEGGRFEIIEFEPENLTSPTN